MKRPLSAPQKLTVVYGVLAIVLILDILQLWLLTATTHAFLGGETRMVVPAALSSAACLALNLGLLAQLRRLDAE